ncbi:unnamed protein product, partial [Tilletia laevis]
DLDGGLNLGITIIADRREGGPIEAGPPRSGTSVWSRRSFSQEIVQEGAFDDDEEIVAFFLLQEVGKDSVQYVVPGILHDHVFGFFLERLVVLIVLVIR